jgi:uncharacterized protein YoxC
MDSSTSLAIIAALFLLNTIFVVAVLVRALGVLHEARKFIEMVRLQIAPLTYDAGKIVNDVRSIVQKTEKEMDKISDGLAAVRDTARNIKEFEELIQERIERPLLDITAILSAIVKGGRVFWTNVIRR